MTPEQALTAVAHQNPRSVLIITETADGKLGLTAGPDMSLEHINYLLDIVKNYVMFRTTPPTTMPIVGAEPPHPTGPPRG